MQNGLRHLLEELIDYAGLFPPAELPMPEAVANYSGYRTGPHSWMLARFICPLGRLEEFEQAVSHLPDPGPGPWPLSLLGKPGGTDLSSVSAGLTRFQDLSRRHPGRFRAESLELALPPREDPGRLSSFLAAVNELDPLPEDLGRIFLETPISGDWETALPRTFAGIRERSRTRPEVGVKIRTGGLTPEAFPAPREVAGFLTTARRSGLAAKATAGLHHPLRHLDPSVGAMAHGFFNVFSGAVLAAAHDWSEDRLIEVLSEEDPAAFRFDEDGISWREFQAGPDEIRTGRQKFALSVGSCSFTEPIEDLEGLGLL